MKARSLAIILALCMCVLMLFSACSDNGDTSTDPETVTESESQTESNTQSESQTESNTQSESQTESNTQSESQTESNADSSSESTESETTEITESETVKVTESETPEVTESETPEITESETPEITESETPEETESETAAPETEPVVEMIFNGSSVSISDTSAVTVSGKLYTITKAGTYRISGNMSDGQIRVNVEKTEKVTLLLDNFTGSCSTSAVIYVMSADKVDIDLEKNSVNSLTDAQIYVPENPLDDKPNACIYSSDDLTIKGGGTLNVTARYNNGIGCKNDLEIKNGVVNVSATKNALKGNDSVTVCGDAVVNVTAAKDALKADTPATERDDKGFVLITDTAYVTVSCDDEAIQATQNITITAGATLKVVEAKNVYKCDGTTSIDEGCII